MPCLTPKTLFPICFLFPPLRYGLLPDHKGELESCEAVSKLVRSCSSLSATARGQCGTEAETTGSSSARRGSVKKWKSCKISLLSQPFLQKR